MQELADQMEVTKGAVANWELRRNLIAPSLALQLVEALPTLTLDAIYDLPSAKPKGKPRRKSKRAKARKAA